MLNAKFCIVLADGVAPLWPLTDILVSYVPLACKQSGTLMWMKSFIMNWPISLYQCVMEVVHFFNNKKHAACPSQVFATRCHNPRGMFCVSYSSTAHVQNIFENFVSYILAPGRQLIQLEYMASINNDDSSSTKRGLFDCDQQQFSWLASRNQPSKNSDATFACSRNCTIRNFLAWGAWNGRHENHISEIMKFRIGKIKTMGERDAQL